MKKFFNIIPFQVQGNLKKYLYTAIGNPKLQLDHETCFPILTAIEGYSLPGEEIAVIAVMADTESGKANLKQLQDEVLEVCDRKQVVCSGVQVVTVPTDDRVATHVSTFQKLLGYMEDDDELFCCMTYGTKPLSTALMMAIQYGYRVKQNTSISCIVYGQIDRPEKDPATWSGKAYDMTALTQLDEIVRVLADRGVENPKEIIDRILAL